MKRLLFLLLFCSSIFSITAQINVQVRVTTVCSSISDASACGVDLPWPLPDISDDPDNGYVYLPYDAPDLDGNGAPSTVLDAISQTYYFENEAVSQGCIPNGEIAFNHDYGCEGACFPAGMNIDWTMGEQDGLYPANIWDVNNSGTTYIPISSTPGTYSQIITTAVSGGGCDGTMSMTIDVIVSGTVLAPVPDNICDAEMLSMGTSLIRSWCQNQTIEAGEPNAPAGGPQDMSNGTAWFYFTAPPSGTVQIDTDLPSTNIGTAFILYHASNGFDCGTITYCDPDKWSYLSELDGGNADFSLNLPPSLYQADLELDCGNLLAGYGGLVPGQIYYIQISSDDPAVCGIIEIRVSDDGGTGAPQYDIPCGATPIVLGTTTISEGAGSTPSTSLNDGCAQTYEVGDYDILGVLQTPYFAYDYDAGVLNNTPSATVWASFVAPNNGTVSIETNCSGSGEFFLVYSPDPCIAPAIPSEYNCVDLVYDAEDSGGDDNAGIGGTTAQSVISCLEPGYTYYILADPSTINFCSALDIWAYNPSAPVPGNDILCIALNNPAYTIPIGAPGSVGPIITGDNTNACHEDLAGEPVLGGAAATVWYEFIAPASGVVAMDLIPGTINNIGYAIYESNPVSVGGNGCYGGLDGGVGSTFTTTQTNDVTITPLYSSNSNTTINAEFCCLTPGASYLLQIDGNSPTSQGTFTINMQEIEIDPGTASLVNTSDFICFGDYVNIISSAEIVPSCMTNGIIAHGEGPNPTYNDILTGTIYGVTPISTNSISFVNDGNSTTIPYNQVVWASAFIDGNASAGFDFSTLCPSLEISTGVPFIFLEPITFSSPSVSVCNASVIVSGGLPAYDNSYFYTYIITAPTGEVIQNGNNLAYNGTLNFSGIGPGVYTILVSDTITNSGGLCDFSTTITIGPDCLCFMDLSAAPLALSVINSICGANCNIVNGAWCLDNNPCPLGSTLQSFSSATSVVSGTPILTAPIYNQTLSETFHVRCVCDDDPTFVSPPQSISSTPGICPIVADPIGITLTPSDCAGGILANGSINGTSTACPLGSTLYFFNDITLLDGGTVIVPSFDQDGPPQTFFCACVDATGCKSSAITLGPTIIGVCPPGCGATIGNYPNGN